MKVRDVMTTDVRTVSPDTPIRAVAQTLVDHGFSGVPVVDSAGAVLGVVSEGDFLAREIGAPRRNGRALWWLWAAGEDRSGEAKLRGTTAGAVMTSPATTIDPDRELTDAALLMSSKGVKRLPVVEGGRLIGIVTRADIVRAFARTDEELLQLARQSVHAVDGLRVESVTDGVAILAGPVAHKSLATTASQVVFSIEGITRVDDSGVTWTVEPEEDWTTRDTEPLLRS
jgi:CBS domain-containing protein